jgi:hypothetical protein
MKKQILTIAKLFLCKCAILIFMNQYVFEEKKINHSLSKSAEPRAYYLHFKTEQIWAEAITTQ